MTDSISKDRPLRQSKTLLLATDSKSSVLAEVTDGKVNSIAYSAYGEQSGRQGIGGRLGFNGELREVELAWYLLGNGYRAYNTVLMRFHSPDSWSPFGEGGLNAYMYCVGDPVNASDPTGHVFNPVAATLSRIFPSSSARNRTMATPDANVHLSVPPAAQQPLRLRTTPRYEEPAPRYTRSSLPTYEEAADLRALEQPEPTSLTQPAQPLSASSHDSGSIGGNRIRPAEPEMQRMESSNSDMPPLPPTRRISDNVVRQYSMSRNPDGTWFHSSVEMFTVRSVRRGGAERH
ncbi:hypothetical protein D3C71_1395230 [compost metagenome]|uniref:RHS repeat-associated core domain-containing protein n=1 Tax=Pseudomonas sp. MAG733B TaxID=3122079 RepID=UPI000F97CEFC